MGEPSEAGAHHYDGCGVCIYCSKCDEPTCCAPSECDRRTLRILTKAVDKTLAERRKA